MKDKIIEYAKLLRLHGWGVYSLTAIFGALTVEEFDILKLSILGLIGLLATIFGFVLNDYADLSIDKLSKDLEERPLVKGTIPKKNAVYISIFVAVLAYLIIFITMYLEIFKFNYIPIVVITVSVISATIYNFYSKKIVASDIFVALSAALFCLFGATIVSEEVSRLTWVLVSLVFLQLFYMNAIIGGLKDADHDYKFGTKNIAYYLGVRVKKEMTVTLGYKIFAFLIRFSSVIIIFLPFFIFKDFTFYNWQPLLLLLMFIGIFYYTVKMLNMKKFDRDKLRKIFAIQEFLRFTAVPVMMIGLIGYKIGLFLIFFPLIWWIIITRMIYGTFLQTKLA